jgi:hypothetical protein
MEFATTADDAKAMLCNVLDGIELMSIDERSKLIRWADGRSALGRWGVPGVKVMIGIHNKCVLENRKEDPRWKGADFIVVD